MGVAGGMIIRAPCPYKYMYSRGVAGLHCPSSRPALLPPMQMTTLGSNCPTLMMNKALITSMLTTFRYAVGVV